MRHWLWGVGIGGGGERQKLPEKTNGGRRGGMKGEMGRDEREKGRIPTALLGGEKRRALRVERDRTCQIFTCMMMIRTRRVYLKSTRSASFAVNLLWFWF